MRIDPYSLELFITTLREGSIAAAARRAHIAPSALSRRLAELETRFGLPLLVRSANGVTATEAGQHALMRAIKLHDDLNAIVREVRSLSDQMAGVVRLFANASAVVGFLPERLKTFQATHPLVDIALHEGSSDEVMTACLDDRADVGICNAMAVTPGLLASWHFADDTLVVIVPVDHPLAAQQNVRFSTVASYPLVSVQHGGALDQLLREHARKDQLTLQTSVAVHGFDGQCRMIGVGLGIGIAPASAAAAFASAPHIVTVPLDEPWAQRSLRLHALHKTPRLKVVQALIDHLTASETLGLP